MRISKAERFVQRTAYSQSCPPQHMCINHCCFHILMTEEFLHGAAKRVITVFQQVGGKTIPRGGFALAESVAGRAPVEPRPMGRSLDRLLQAALTHVVAAYGTAARVF